MFNNFTIHYRPKFYL